jgi:hypothetical protein
LWNRRLIQIGATVALASVVLGLVLGQRLRLFELFFAGCLVSLLFFYSRWVQPRRRLRIAILAVGFVCVVGALLAEFV